MPRFLLATIALIVWTPCFIRADEPAKETDKFNVPAPQAVPSDAVPYYITPPLAHRGTREIWQYYGVDRRGRWVPRVILAPSEAYYYYNGAPFRYTTTQPTLYMPYVVD